jgi:hypothetical protein
MARGPLSWLPFSCRLCLCAISCYTFSLHSSMRALHPILTRIVRRRQGCRWLQSERPMLFLRHQMLRVPWLMPAATAAGAPRSRRAAAGSACYGAAAGTACHGAALARMQVQPAAGTACDRGGHKLGLPRKEPQPHSLPLAIAVGQLHHPKGMQQVGLFVAMMTACVWLTCTLGTIAHFSVSAVLARVSTLECLM